MTVTCNNHLFIKCNFSPCNQMCTPKGGGGGAKGGGGGVKGEEVGCQQCN